MHTDLKLDRARLHCRKVKGDASGKIRELVVLRGPANESSVRLDRTTGRLLTLAVDRLPLPELSAPTKGWPALAGLERIARNQGEIPAEETASPLVHPDQLFLFGREVGGGA